MCGSHVGQACMCQVAAERYCMSTLIQHAKWWPIAAAPVELFTILLRQYTPNLGGA